MEGMTRRELLLWSTGMVAALSACGKSGSSPTDSTDIASPADALYSYRFADAKEGVELLLSNEDYINGFNQQDLDFRLQKKGGTVEEWKEFAAQQVLDFTDEEKRGIAKTMAEIEALIAERGIALPPSEEIVFVRTTMHEEGDAGAYTHGTQIYLGQRIATCAAIEVEALHTMGLGVLTHELFHCLTRSNPDFRAQMYSVIGFEVQDEDYAFGPHVTGQMISNPDVEHHNSSATFAIDGQDRRCTAVFYANPGFEKPGDNFFDLGKTGLVPVDDLNTIIDSSEASNFWEVFGENTDYVIDPEETMADNFSFAIVFGRDGMDCKTPRIIDDILTKLAK